MKYMDIIPPKKRKAVKVTVITPRQRPIPHNAAMQPQPESNNNIVVG